MEWASCLLSLSQSHLSHLFPYQLSGLCKELVFMSFHPLSWPTIAKALRKERRQKSEVLVKVKSQWSIPTSVSAFSQESVFHGSTNDYGQDGRVTLQGWSHGDHWQLGEPAYAIYPKLYQLIWGGSFPLDSPPRNSDSVGLEWYSESITLNKLPRSFWHSQLIHSLTGSTCIQRISLKFIQTVYNCTQNTAMFPAFVKLLLHTG